MRIKVTEKGKMPYIKDVKDSIAKIYLAKKNPNFKYEEVKDEPEKPVEAKKEDLNFGKPKKEVK